MEKRGFLRKKYETTVFPTTTFLNLFKMTIKDAC